MTASVLVLSGGFAGLAALDELTGRTPSWLPCPMCACRPGGGATGWASRWT